jgi:hypothetical protein
MKIKILQTVRVPSLILAAALQIFPMARAALPSAGAATNVLAIIFRWAVGAAAVGAVDAVSGASTVITTPLSTNLTQGQSFAVRLATAPHLAYYWTATNLPAGLSLSGISGGSFWQITGAPTVNGTYNVSLAASDSASFPAGRTVVGIMVIHIAPPPGSQPSIATPPASLVVTQGQAAQFFVTANGSAPFSYQWRLNGLNLGGKTSTNLLITSATTNDAGNYTVIVTNVFGSITSAPAKLSVITLPVITTQPTSQSNYVGTTFFFSVAASSAAPLTYQWRKDGTALSNSSHIVGSQSNSCRINFAQTNDSGNYTVVLANASGSVTSQVAVLTVTPIFSTLAVLVNGQGSVAPNYDGQSLQLGTAYTMTATPGAGYYFTNWTGSIKTNSSTITFVMKSNLVLQANFLFPFVKGIYHGLFYDPNGVTVSNAGGFTLTTTTGGKYSGTLALAGKKFALSGAFNIFGNASNRISLTKSNVALVSLSIDSSDTDRIAGSVSNASWFVPLSGDRATFSATNPAPQIGNFTLTIPGTPGSTSNPAGTSFGTLNVSVAGNITFAGALADGTKISQASAVSKDGSWPLYVPLYSTNGLVFGWQTFTNTSTDDLSGPVCWIKTAQANAKYFPAGFAFIPSLSGSAYLAPALGIPAINLPLANLILTDGGLSQSYTNLISMLSNNKATNIAGTKLTLSVTSKTGVFSGNFFNPGNGKTVPISGVVNQKLNSGAGFFLSTNLSGQVYF